MKKQAFLFLVSSILSAMLAVPYLYAQSSMRLKGKIPFDFVVGDTTFSSGEYTVQSSQAGPQTVMIQSRDGRECAVHLSIPVEARHTPEKGKLVFKRYGDQYFLSQLWHPGMNTGRELLKSKAEHEMAKNASQPQVATVIVP